MNSNETKVIALKPRDRQQSPKRRISWTAVRQFVNAHGRKAVIARAVRRDEHPGRTPAA